MLLLVQCPLVGTFPRRGSPGEVWVPHCNHGNPTRGYATCEGHVREGTEPSRHLAHAQRAKGSLQGAPFRRGTHTLSVRRRRVPSGSVASTRVRVTTPMSITLPLSLLLTSMIISVSMSMSCEYMLTSVSVIPMSVTISLTSIYIRCLLCLPILSSVLGTCYPCLPSAPSTPSTPSTPSVLISLSVLGALSMREC